MTDADVIVRSWEYPGAFAIIFHRHHSVIYRHVACRAGPEVAADVASEVFVRAFAARRSYKVEYPSARPWLFGITANLLRQHFRRLHRGSSAFGKVAGRSPWAVSDFTLDADARVDALALSSQLHAGLGMLREVDREVLVLYACDELSYAEIAAALAIPIGTVRSRMSRARRLLRELMGEAASRLKAPDSPSWTDAHAVSTTSVTASSEPDPIRRT